MPKRRSRRRYNRWHLALLPMLTSLGISACTEHPVPDAIFTGNFVTLDPEQPRVEALAVAEGRILRVGSRAHVEELAGPRTRRIEFPGTAVPGWAESHGHPTGVAPRETGLDFYGMTKGEVLRAVAEAVDATPVGHWITGRAWDEGFWDPPEFPTAGDLDALSEEHPMRFSRLGGHGSWVNSKALELAGITRGTPDPAGGRIDRTETGEASGFLVDTAEELLPSPEGVPEATPEDVRLRAGLNQYARWGVTAVHDAGADLDRIALYKQWAEAGELPVRVYAMAQGVDAVEHYLRLGPEIEVGGDGMLSIRSFKLMLDGSLGGRGAALSDPYADDPTTRGVDMMTEDELDRLIMEARARGIQLNVHVIGDRAVTRALDAFERGGVTPSDRFRLEHASVIAPDDVARIVRLGVIPSMQAVFVGEYSRWAESRLGPERARWVKPIRDLLDAGATVVQGTDYPASDSGDPVHTLFGLVARKDAAARPDGGWNSEQRIDVEEALVTMSVGPAFAAFQDKDLGRLTVGRYADFTVLSADPLRIPEEALRNLSVWMTVVGGRITFDAAEDTSDHPGS